MVNKKTKEICLAFCKPIVDNGNISIDNQLSISELEKRINWGKKEINQYLTSIGSGNTYFNYDISNGKLFLTEEGIKISQKSIEKFKNEFHHFISHFYKIFRGEENKNKELSIDENNCNCKILNKKIKYFPKFKNLIDAIICYIQLNDCLNKNTLLTDIENFLNNLEIFSNDYIRYFNYIINYGCGSLRKFLCIPVCNSIFEISNQNQIVKLKSSLTNKHAIFNKNNNEIYIEIKIEIFNYLLQKKNKNDEINLEEISNIIKKYGIDRNITEVVEDVLNIKYNYFKKKDNKYIINMEKVNIKGSKEYNPDKSFISQCLWIHPYFEKCLIIIIDYIRMQKAVNSIEEIEIDSIQRWLIKHYSWNEKDVRIINTFIEKCGGLLNFLKADINYNYFHIKENNNKKYIILKSSVLDNTMNIKEKYHEYHLESKPIILKSYDNNELSMNYSYFSLKNNCEIDEDIELKIFTAFFISCSKNIGIICNVHNLLKEININEHIKAKIEHIDRLKELIFQENQLKTKEYIIDKESSNIKEILILNFNNENQIKFNKYYYEPLNEESKSNFSDESDFEDD
eukprot:jgi/Orpsp1_1/1176559/evm.model.c7180000058078.1